MNSEEKFKDLLNSKLQQKEFSFEPADWDKAKAAINDERKRKKRGFIYFSLIGVFIGLISTYFIIGENKNNNLLSVNIKEQKQNLGKDIVIKSTTLSDSETKTSKKAKVLEIVNNPTLNKTEENRVKVRISHTKNKTENNTNIKQTNTVKNINESQNTSNTNQNTNIAITKQSILNDNKGNENNSKPTVNNFSSINDTIYQINPLQIKIVNGVTLLSPDTVAIIQTLNTHIASGKSIPKNMLLLEVGTNYLIGWRNNNSNEARGFNAIIGLNYYTVIKSKIGLQIGLQYSTINNLNNTTYTSKTTRLKFGEESDITKISALNMHYLIAPLKLHYNFNTNNSFGIGYNLGYLLDVKSKVETYTEKVGVQSNYSTSKTYGYYDGFSKMDRQLSIFYKRTIYKNLFLNTEFVYGLKDIKNNTIFNTSDFERSLGFKITLSCNLFKK